MKRKLDVTGTLFYRRILSIVEADLKGNDVLTKTKKVSYTEYKEADIPGIYGTGIGESNTHKVFGKQERQRRAAIHLYDYLV